MPLTNNAIQAAIDKLEGESGSNVAQSALRDLTSMFNKNFDMPLDKRQNQVDMLGDLDSCIGELILFRESMITAINNGDSELVEPEITGIDKMKPHSRNNEILLILSDLPDKSEVY